MSAHAAAIERSLPQLVEFRHRLHQIPELGYEEFKTAAAIRAELDRLGIEHVDGVPDAPTATIAMIGDTTKPCVALRPTSTRCRSSSRPACRTRSTHAGRMHACGHDGHTTTLIGVGARPQVDRATSCPSA